MASAIVAATGVGVNVAAIAAVDATHIGANVATACAIVASGALAASASCYCAAHAAGVWTVSTAIASVAVNDATATASGTVHCACIVAARGGACVAAANAWTNA